MSIDTKLSPVQIAIQVVLWCILFSMPMLGVLYIGGSWLDGIKAVYQMTPNHVMWLGCFYLNYMLYIPHFLLRKRIWIYLLILVPTYVIMGNINGYIYYIINGEKWQGTGNEGVDTAILLGQVLFNAMLCLAAIAIRVMQRNKYLLQQLDETRNSISETSEQNSVESKESQPEEQTFMFVKCEARQVRVNFDDILYISAMKDYVRIHLTSQPRPLIALSTMKGIEEKLPKNYFCRVHRSYIVRMDKIESIERNRIKIGNELIPVSESYIGVFQQRLG